LSASRTKEWPNISKELLLVFLDALEKARAEDEHRRIGQIGEAAKGGRSSPGAT
jgi:hypothetical protein